MQKSKTQIVIIDDELAEKHPLVITLQQYFNSVKTYKKASTAIEIIKQNQNLGNKIILILDMKLSGNEDGHKVLSELREFSYLIPVIIWTGVPEKDKSRFYDLINLKTYAIRDKTASLSEMVTLIQKVDADIEYGLSNALAKWLIAQPGDHDKPYLISTGGKSYSLNDILNEVQNETPKGREFTQDLVNLTLELMVKNKENE